MLTADAPHGITGIDDDDDDDDGNYGIGRLAHQKRLGRRDSAGTDFGKPTSQNAIFILCTGVMNQNCAPGCKSLMSTGTEC